MIGRRSWKVVWIIIYFYILFLSVCVVLQTSVDEALQKTKGFESEEEYQEKLELLEKEKQNIINEIMKTEEECSSVEAELEHVKNEEQRYLERYSQMCDEMNKEIPRMQYLLNLYADISRLRTKNFFSSWDQLEDVFSGYIMSANGEDIQPFELSVKTNSSFAIVNQLWDMFERSSTWCASWNDNLILSIVGS